MCPVLGEILNGMITLTCLTAFLLLKNGNYHEDKEIIEFIIILIYSRNIPILQTCYALNYDVTIDLVMCLHCR